jgi:hypothetical protein
VPAAGNGTSSRSVAAQLSSCLQHQITDHLLHPIHETLCAFGTGVGPETAEAVLRVYPTPRSLYEAWLRSRGAAEPSGGFQCRQARAPCASPLRLLEGIEARGGIRACQSQLCAPCV